MRQRSLRVVVALSACFFGAGAIEAQQSAAPNGEAQARSQVENVEQRWITALQRADTVSIGSILADDFVRPAPQSGQFIDKAALLDYYRTHLVPATTEHKQIEDMSVTVYGDTAIARGKVVTTNAAGRVTAQLLFTDVFVRRNGSWLAISAQENPVSLAQKP